MSMEIVVRGEDGIRNKLMKIAGASYRSEFDEIGTMLVGKFSGDVFVSRGGAIGESWPALSPGYQKQKAKRYPGRPINIATGEMQNSFNHNTSDQSVEVTNSAPHFKYPQKGTGKMPKRQMMKLTPSIKKDAIDIVSKGVDRVLRQS